VQGYQTIVKQIPFYRPPCSFVWKKNVAKFGGYKKQDSVKSLKINNLQSLVVPRAGDKVLVAIGGYCVFIVGYLRL
jgi:hypothetical protein